jgi:hypothetical protein
VFKTQFYLDRHKNKKLPCAPEEKAQRNAENCTCPHCNHTYTKPCVLRDHLPKCPMKPYQETEIDKLKQIILQLSDKLTETTLFSNQHIEKLENKIDKLMYANNKTSIPFGEEKNSLIDKDYICDTNLFLLSNKNTEMKPTKKSHIKNKQKVLSK